MAQLCSICNNYTLHVNSIGLTGTVKTCTVCCYQFLCNLDWFSSPQMSLVIFNERKSIVLNKIFLCKGEFEYCLKIFKMKCFI